MSDSWIWDKYWHSDRIASCFDGAGAHNYGGAIAESWRAFYAALPPGARILDLCTGNGAIAIIAAESGRSQGKGFEVVAVDQAAIDPQNYVTRHREELDAVRFMAGVAIEALPFPNDSFDAVVSQYGIEYSDLPQSIAELGRVIAPAGCARLVLHASQGTIAIAAKRVVGDADLLIDAIGLPSVAALCFEAVTTAERKPDASEAEHRAARESLAAFEAALVRTAQHIPQAADQAMLRKSAAVLLDTFKRRGHFDLEQLLAKAEEVRGEILAHRGRLAALIDAAVDPAAVIEVESLLRKAGAGQVATSDLLVDGALVGYAVEGRFPG